MFSPWAHDCVCSQGTDFQGQKWPCVWEEQVAIYNLHQGFSQSQVWRLREPGKVEQVLQKKWNSLRQFSSSVPSSWGPSAATHLNFSVISLCWKWFDLVEGVERFPGGSIYCLVWHISLGNSAAEDCLDQLTPNQKAVPQQWGYCWGSSGDIPMGRVCVCPCRVRLEVCILNLSHPGEIWSSGTVLLRSYAVESLSSGRTHGVTGGWVISLLIHYNEVQSCPRHDLCHPLPTLFGTQSKMQCLPYDKNRGPSNPLPFPSRSAPPPHLVLY